MNTELLPRDGLILCAVSGGADSVYLLCRLRELGFRTAAAHFHHGLRSAADRDEEFVRNLCGEFRVPLVTERGDTAAFAAQRGLGIEEAARALRYDFLERAADSLGAAVIATAHTADDNAETVLMRLTRGAGLRGLGGIPPVRGRIVRPMLDETHAQALSYMQEHGIPHVEDETNSEDLYFRNRVRHSVMPVLTAENPAFSRTVSRAAALLREDEAYLSSLASAFIAQNASDGSVSAAALTALPRPIALRVIRSMAGTEFSAEQTLSILTLAAAGGGLDVSGLHAACWGGRLYFGAKDVPPLPDRMLTPGQTLRLPECGLTVSCDLISSFPADVNKSLNTFYFNCANIIGNVMVTARRPGDRLRPLGRGCTKALKQLFVEAGIPPWRRSQVPVLRDERGILGIQGVARDERARVSTDDCHILRVSFSREEHKCETI